VSLIIYLSRIQCSDQDTKSSSDDFNKVHSIRGSEKLNNNINPYKHTGHTSSHQIDRESANDLNKKANPEDAESFQRKNAKSLEEVNINTIKTPRNSILRKLMELNAIDGSYEKEIQKIHSMIAEDKLKEEKKQKEMLENTDNETDTSDSSRSKSNTSDSNYKSSTSDSNSTQNTSKTNTSDSDLLSRSDSNSGNTSSSFVSKPMAISLTSSESDTPISTSAEPSSEAASTQSTNQSRVDCSVKINSYTNTTINRMVDSNTESVSKINSKSNEKETNKTNVDSKEKMKEEDNQAKINQSSFTSSNQLLRTNQIQNSKESIQNKNTDCSNNFSVQSSHPISKLQNYKDITLNDPAIKKDIQANTVPQNLEDLKNLICEDNDTRCKNIISKAAEILSKGFEMGDLKTVQSRIENASESIKHIKGANFKYVNSGSKELITDMNSKPKNMDSYVHSKVLKCKIGKSTNDIDKIESSSKSSKIEISNNGRLSRTIKLKKYNEDLKNSSINEDILEKYQRSDDVLLTKDRRRSKSLKANDRFKSDIISQKAPMPVEKNLIAESRRSKAMPDMPLENNKRKIVKSIRREESSMDKENRSEMFEMSSEFFKDSNARNSNEKVNYPKRIEATKNREESRYFEELKFNNQMSNSQEHRKFEELKSGEAIQKPNDLKIQEAMIRQNEQLQTEQDIDKADKKMQIKSNSQMSAEDMRVFSAFDNMAANENANGRSFLRSFFGRKETKTESSADTDYDPTSFKLLPPIDRSKLMTADDNPILKRSLENGDHIIFDAFLAKEKIAQDLAYEEKLKNKKQHQLKVSKDYESYKENNIEENNDQSTEISETEVSSSVSYEPESDDSELSSRNTDRSYSNSHKTPISFSGDSKSDLTDISTTPSDSSVKNNDSSEIPYAIQCRSERIESDIETNAGLSSTLILQVAFGPENEKVE
jgi:trimeric autotransporter adhesin